jgi:hypothetical protein
MVHALAWAKPVRGAGERYPTHLAGASHRGPLTPKPARATEAKPSTPSCSLINRMQSSELARSNAGEPPERPRQVTLIAKPQHRRDLANRPVIL